MKPRTAIGLLLTLVGGGIILWGVWEALKPLADYYQASLNSAMSQPDDAEQKLSAAMMRGVKIGLVGVLPMIIGSVMLKISMFQRLRNRKRSR